VSSAAPSRAPFESAAAALHAHASTAYFWYPVPEPTEVKSVFLRLRTRLAQDAVSSRTSDLTTT